MTHYTWNHPTHPTRVARPEDASFAADDPAWVRGYPVEVWAGSGQLLSDEDLDQIRHNFGLNSRLDKHDFRDVARVVERRTLAALASQTPGEVSAWMHPDGRVIPASTMDAARRDGGATLSAVSGYTIPLRAGAQTPGEGWISVEDGLPAVGTERGGVDSVLVLYAEAHCPNGGSRWQVCNTVYVNKWARTDHFTHWMPLPKPPATPTGAKS